MGQFRGGSVSDRKRTSGLSALLFAGPGLVRGRPYACVRITDFTC